MTAGRVHHVDLVVSSLARSVPFYRALLAPLGWTREDEIVGERGERVVYLSGEADSIGLREAQSPAGAYDRYAIGLHHLALSAPSRAAVEDGAERARVAGATIESGPAEYDYLPGYYAVFLHDPDGLKLELVHVP